MRVHSRHLDEQFIRQRKTRGGKRERVDNGNWVGSEIKSNTGKRGRAWKLRHLTKGKQILLYVGICRFVQLLRVLVVVSPPLERCGTASEVFGEGAVNCWAVHSCSWTFNMVCSVCGCLIHYGSWITEKLNRALNIENHIRRNIIVWQVGTIDKKKY